MQLILANVGLPMLVLMLPAFVVSLPLVIAIETGVVMRQLEVPARPALASVAWANVASTIVGVPVAWVLLVVLEMLIGYSLASLWPWRIHEIVGLVLQAPWLGMGAEQRPWLVPGAALVLLVPFCAASCWVERRVVGRGFPYLPGPAIDRAVLRANLASYAGFAVLCAVWLIAEIGEAR